MTLMMPMMRRTPTACEQDTLQTESFPVVSLKLNNMALIFFLLGLGFGTWTMLSPLEAASKTARASASSQSPDFSNQEGRDFVQHIGDRIIQLLQDKKLSREEQERRYRQILDDHFDMPAIALYTLGRYRKQVTEKETLKEFIEVFTKVIVQSYVDQFSQYKNQTLVIEGREYAQGPYLVVSSHIAQNGGKNIDVQWYIKQRDSKNSLAVYELVVEGVGLKKTKRNIYAPTLREKGIQGLIQDLKGELKRY